MKSKPIRKYEEIGICVPDILLPKKGIDLNKWSVVAVDQYTSEPDYWNNIKKIVGDAPSTLKMVYPEIYLEEPNKEERITSIVNTMNEYLSSGLFQEHNGFVYVERRIKEGKTRKGLVVCLDLDKYDYNRDSKTLIRATEGTILERLPPRITIRKDALIESPHVMVLIDDPRGKVVDILTEKKEDMDKLYDFELMENGGHLEGYLVKKKFEKKIVKGLEKLATQKVFKKKYKLKEDLPLLLYAMGDGNHSLATAKSIWEEIKRTTVNKEDIINDPRRYALVELVNIHDESLEFEAIHRVIFNLNKDIIKEMKAFFGGSFKMKKKLTKEEMIELVRKEKQKTKHVIGFVSEKGCGLIKIRPPKNNLPVGTLQEFLDKFMQNGFAEKIDYVHGSEVLATLASKEKNCGFYLPLISKKQFFRTVVLDGALPRKSFSMGEANEKRFYLECRKIKE